MHIVAIGLWLIYFIGLLIVIEPLPIIILVFVSFIVSIVMTFATITLGILFLEFISWLKND